MAVNLTLGFQDQYSAGFQQLTAEMEAQEKATQKLAAATQEHNNALARMSKEHANANSQMSKGVGQLRQASGSLDVALGKNSKSLKEAGLSMGAAGTAARIAGGNIGGIVGQLTGIQGTGEAAAKVLQKYGGTLAKAGAIAGVAYGSFKLVQHLVPHIVEDSTNAVMDRWNKTWEKGKKNLQENFAWLKDVRAAVSGLSEEQRKLMNINEQQAESWKRLREFKATTDKEIASQREIQEIQKIGSQQAINLAIQEQEQKLASLAAQDDAEEKVIKEAEARYKALLQQREAITIEHQNKLEAFSRESSERERQRNAGAAARERRDIEYTSDLQMKKWQEEWNFKVQLNRLREQAEVSEKDRNIKLIQERITQKIDAEKEADLKAADSAEDRRRIEVEAERKKLSAIKDLDRQSILNRAALETKATEDKAEQARIAARTIEELREMEFRHAMEFEQKKVAAAKEAAEREYQIEREKLDKIKALTDKQGKNVFQNLMGQQAGRKDDQGRSVLFEEMVRQRMAAAKQADPDMSRQQEMQMNRFIRRMTARGLTTTGEQTSQAETQRVMSDLAANSVLKGAAQGKVNQQFVKVAAEQAKSELEQRRFNEETARQLQELQNANKTAAQLSQQQTERLRAQRRAIRG